MDNQFSDSTNAVFQPIIYCYNSRSLNNIRSNVDQLTLEVKFYLNKRGQNIIEIGKRLNQAKDMLPHGEFGKWLEKNFNLSYPTATKFMNVFRRFSNVASMQHLNPSQMIIMLSLPEGDEQAFIDAQKDAGQPLENQTNKETRKNVKGWKKKAQEKEAEADNLREQNKKLQDRIDLQHKIAESNAGEFFKLRAQYEKLQQEKSVEVIPSDYEDIKKQLADLQAKQDFFEVDIATSQALNQFFMMANFLLDHQDRLPNVLTGYYDSEPLTHQRIEQISDISALLNKILNDIIR